MHTIYDMGGHNRQDAERFSDQQAEIERLKAEHDVAYAQVAALREALGDALNTIKVWHDIRENDEENWEIYVTHSPEMQRIGAALADPSPQADAVRAVVKEAIAVSEKRNEFGGARLGLTALDSSVDAYRAVSRGDGVQGNE